MHTETYIFNHLKASGAFFLQHQTIFRPLWGHLGISWPCFTSDKAVRRHFGLMVGKLGRRETLLRIALWVVLPHGEFLGRFWGAFLEPRNDRTIVRGKNGQLKSMKKRLQQRGLKKRPQRPRTSNKNIFWTQRVSNKWAFRLGGVTKTNSGS